jgi:hypothetical protein
MPNVESPIEMSRSFGRFGRIPAVDVDYCDGPISVGSTPRTFKRYEYRWVFWQAVDGVRMQRLDLFAGNESGGMLTGLFDGATISPLSACFDGVAEPVVATESGGDVLVRKFELGVPTDYVFAGKSPMVFYTGQLYFSPVEREVIVFYLNAAGSEIRVRRQLTGFAVESVVGALPYPLSKLTKVDHKLRRLWLWGMTVPSVAGRRGTVRQTAIRSDEYPPFPELAEDSASGRASLQSGSYIELMVPIPLPQEDFAGAAASLATGAYTETIVTAAADEVVSAAAGLEAGSYELRILAASETEPPVEAGADLQSGSYVEILKLAGTQQDKASAGASLAGGEYSIP